MQMPEICRASWDDAAALNVEKASHDAIAFDKNPP
jgi:hypothetical protein